MTAKATLSSDFRIRIPKSIRMARGWEAGLTLALLPKGKGRVLLVTVPERETLCGLARGASGAGYRDREGAGR